MNSRKHQKGTTVVEFSIAASVLFLLLFAVMEFGRMMYTCHLLQESTRSAARMAVISTYTSPGLHADVTEAVEGLLPEGANLSVKYLNMDGDPATGAGDTVFVRASISDYSMKLLIPLPGLTEVTAPTFTTTQVAESLGDNPTS